MTDEQIVARCQAGENALQIAVDAGCGTSKIYRTLRRNGIATGNGVGQRNTTSKRYQAEIVRAYQAGETMEVIAARFNVNRLTVRNTLNRNGVNTRRRGPASKGITEAERVSIASLRGSGWSIEEIAVEIGRGYVLVSSIITELGLPVRIDRRDRKDRVGVGQGYFGVWVSRDDPIYPMSHARNTSEGGGYVLEHRAVMARHLGRCLRDEETVHHVNGQRGDNRAENLQLRQGKHGKGVCMRCLDCGSYNVEPLELH